MTTNMVKNYDTINITSSLDNINEVQGFIEGVCDTMNIHNYVGTISMAVLEAVENAIVHGNQMNQEKIVTVSISRNDLGIMIRICDQGGGFDFNRYKLMPEQEGIGDGIFLMRTLSDEIYFLNNGSVVEMYFRVNGIEISKNIERKTAINNYFHKQCVRV